jgi:hypothetical protein
MKTKKSKKIQIEFDYDHLAVLTTALEVFSRLRSGQVDMAMSEAYWDRLIDWNEREAIHRHVRYVMFPSLPERRYDGHGGFYDQYNNEYDESGSIIKESEEWKKKKTFPNLDHPNSSFGVGNTKEMREGTIAWEIKKVIEQYLHYERNDGYRRICDVSGDGVMKFSDVEPPQILDSINGYWKPQKEFRIPQRYQEKVSKAIKNKEYNQAWDLVYKAFEKNPLPKGNMSSIQEVSGSYYVIIEKPYKLNEKEY